RVPRGQAGPLCPVCSDRAADRAGGSPVLERRAAGALCQRRDFHSPVPRPGVKRHAAAALAVMGAGAGVAPADEDDGPGAAAIVQHLPAPPSQAISPRAAAQSPMPAPAIPTPFVYAGAL